MFFFQDSQLKMHFIRNIISAAQSQLGKHQVLCFVQQLPLSSIHLKKKKKKQQTNL